MGKTELQTIEALVGRNWGSVTTFHKESVSLRMSSQMEVGKEWLLTRLKDLHYFNFSTAAALLLSQSALQKLQWKEQLFPGTFTERING